MAGAGLIILFVVSMVGCGIWTALYLLFASHYFLTVLTESSGGNDEIQFSGEGITECWWKPLLFLWVLGPWVVTLAIICSPLMAVSPLAFGIAYGMAVLFVYPLSLMSVLYAGNWFFIIHPQVIGRVLKHYGAVAYVYVLTLVFMGVAAGLVFAAATRSIVWGAPLIVALPTSALLIARHWGRLSWVSLNFDARGRKKKRAPAKESQPETAETAPEMDVQEVEEFEEALANDATIPLTESPTPEPMPSVASTTAPVEEDEEKSPYAMAETGNPAYEAVAAAEKSEADKPLGLSNYYEEKARKEKEAEEKKRAERGLMPKLSRKKPSFQTAFLGGAWRFMIDSRMVQVWINFILLTGVELFFLILLRNFWPTLD